MGVVSSASAETNATSSPADAYTRTITERAGKIVATLELEDGAKETRVRDVIARQYRDLSGIHEVRDLKIKAAKVESVSTNKVSADDGFKAAQDEASMKMNQLHGEFLARLSAELSPTQIEKVKDGLTYGVVPLTYGVYLKMHPDLTDPQKKQIMAWLVEARELAMDGGSSKEKHAVFGKYKGRINNFLSAAGYDAKKAEQNLRKSSTPASQKN